MKNIKVAHFTQFLGIGGLEKVILELALRQQSQGLEVAVIVYDHEKGWVDFFKAQGIRVIDQIRKADGLDLSLPQQFVQLIEEEKFDIIHTHDINPLIYLGLSKILFTLKHAESFKIVHTAHTLDHVENSKKVEYLERIMSHLANQIVAVSNKIKNFYEKTVLVDPAHLQLIENGISQKASLPLEISERKNKIIEQYNLNPALPIGLCLSRIVPLKDQKFLVDILKQREDAQLLIVGPPSDQSYYQVLEEIIESNPLRNIKLLGPRADVIELNEISDFYLSASTHEGLPVSVLEAMSVGSPCLVSDIAGHLVLNQYGKVVDTYRIGDARDFSLKLDQLLQKIHSGDMGTYKQGIKIVDEYFSTKKMEKRYQEVYLK